MRESATSYSLSPFPPGDAHTVSILVVDDSPSDAQLVVAAVRGAKPHWQVRMALSGAAALSMIREQVPDLLVTDLRMPGMDGMELLGKVRIEFPELPVVIFTALGSERLAVEALEQGAASYIPKTQLKERLVETIDQVLDRARTDHSYQRLIGSLESTQYIFRLDNDPALIPPLVDLFQQIAYGVQLVDATERRRLGIALDEALLNAMYHGNLELASQDLAAARHCIRAGQSVPSMQQRTAEPPYGDRRVTVQAVLSPAEGRFVIRDEGSGFHPSRIPHAGDPKTLEKQGGRGLVLMANFMDELLFNDIGNEVTMIKRRRTPVERS